MITFIACTTTSVKPTKELTPVIDETILTVDKKVKSFVNVTKYTNFTEKEKVKASKYIPVMDAVINSKCFMDNMVMRELKKTNGKTNKEVVEHLRTSTVDIELIMYYKRFSKVAGYTKPSVNKIWLNRKYHSGASNCSEASNLAHELSHKIKYGHDYKATIDRPLSVPYSINAAFKSCCK
jgi:hypothetical protein